jgi:aryl-alcohol dehydrogenase-like predicted oxidoreductase
MEYVNFGSTGLRVSQFCLGTMTFGLQCDVPTSHAILNHAVDKGITFLDLADVYPVGGTLETVGRTEEIVGEWMRGRRDEFIIASKCNGAMGRQPWNQGNSRKHILDAVDASLARLNTDYIDLYQLHGTDPNTPLDETLEALNHLLVSGKVRYIGVSNWLAWHLALALGRADALKVTRIASIQPRYNLLFREFERELFPLCASEGVAVIPYNPIAGGMLSGKHVGGEPPEGTRFTLGNAAWRYQERYWHDRVFDTVEAIRGVADEAGLPMATLAVAWVMANPVVTAPILGASRPEQLDATMAAADVTLDADLLARLDELTVAYRFGDADR